MKKIIAIVLLLAMALCLCACGEKTKEKRYIGVWTGSNNGSNFTLTLNKDGSATCVVTGERAGTYKLRWEADSPYVMTLYWDQDPIPAFPTTKITAERRPEFTSLFSMGVNKSNDTRVNYYADWTLDYQLTVSKDMKFEPGAWSIQCDAWGEEYIDLIPEGMTVKKGETVNLLEMVDKSFTCKEYFSNKTVIELGIKMSDNLRKECAGTTISTTLVMTNPENADQYYVLSNDFAYEIAENVAAGGTTTETVEDSTAEVIADDTTAGEIVADPTDDTISEDPTDDTISEDPTDDTISEDPTEGEINEDAAANDEAVVEVPDEVVTDESTEGSAADGKAPRREIDVNLVGTASFTLVNGEIWLAFGEGSSEDILLFTVALKKVA